MKIYLILLKVFLFIIVISVVVLFFGCFRLGKLLDAEKSDSYFYKPFNKKSVIFSPGGNWFELGYYKLEGIDSKSFKVLSGELAEDRNGIYYCGRLQNHIDANSFVFDARNILIKDKNHV